MGRLVLRGQLSPTDPRANPAGATADSQSRHRTAGAPGQLTQALHWGTQSGRLAGTLWRRLALDPVGSRQGAAHGPRIDTSQLQTHRSLGRPMPTAVSSSRPYPRPIRWHRNARAPRPAALLYLHADRDES